MTTKEYVQKLKKELLIIKITQSMFYGAFKAETNNEREWFDLMNELGLWLNDEDEIINRIKQLKNEIEIYAK